MILVYSIIGLGVLCASAHFGYQYIVRRQRRQQSTLTRSAAAKAAWAKRRAPTSPEAS